MKPYFAASLILILLMSCGSPTVDRLESSQFPIHAWIGPPSSETTIERYEELANAGFTHSMSGFPDNEAMAKALDIAEACGIELFIHTPELRYEDPEGTVKRFMDHPALGGYHLRDEPSAEDFAELGQWVKRVRAVDDNHPCYINVFPNYVSKEQLGTPTYREHVRRFIEEVPVQMLTFDHYPVAFDSLRPEWYENLEIIAEAAKTAGKPFWAFSLAVAHGPYPIPEISHIRLQVYSNLAYGAQGIQYFTYWTPQSTRLNFHEGPIRLDGTRSPVYELVRRVNDEIKGLSGVFKGSRMVTVGHTGTLPRGTHAYAPVAPFTSLETDGSDGAVVSRLERDTQRFLVVVNRDIDDVMKLTAETDGSVPIAVVGKTGALTYLDTPAYTAEVEPGDIVVFTWEEE